MYLATLTRRIRQDLKGFKCRVDYSNIKWKLFFIWWRIKSLCRYSLLVCSVRFLNIVRIFQSNYFLFSSHRQTANWPWIWLQSYSCWHCWYHCCKLPVIPLQFVFVNLSNIHVRFTINLGRSDNMKSINLNIRWIFH